MKVLLYFFLFPLQLFSQDIASVNHFVDSLMATVNRSDMPASLLIIAKDGKPLVRKAFGMASLELAAPATPGHLFTLASVNKQMIAVCILQLAYQGKLRLTDDIRTYLPKFETQGEIITIEQLLNHTSGIFSGNSPVRGKSFYSYAHGKGLLSDDEFMDYIMKVPLSFKPGTDWTWNTWAFHIAFFIVEKVSGMPFNDYAHKYLFAPAGMTNSFSKVAGNRLGLYGIKDLLSSFYYRDFDGKWIWRDTRRLTPYFSYQRYSVVTCLDDLVKWDAALREGKLLPKEWLEKAWTSGRLKDGSSINYGLGWVVSEQEGYRLLSHIGIGTNPICAVHVPEERLYIVYTQFFGNYEQVELKVKKILSRLLSITYPGPANIEEPLSDYTGVYEVKRTGLDIANQISEVPVYLQVTSNRDTLYLRQTAGERIVLRPAGRDRFLPVGSENTFYIFSRDKGGKVNAIQTRGSFWSYGPEVLNRRVNRSLSRTAITTVEVPVSLLKKYAGLYYMADLDSYVFIKADGGKIYNVAQGLHQELIPVSTNRFVRKNAEDVSYEFGADILVVSGLRKIAYKKVE